MIHRKLEFGNTDDETDDDVVMATRHQGVAVVDEQEASTVDEAGSTVVKPYTASVTRRGALGVPAAFQSINQSINQSIY